MRQRKPLRGRQCTLEARTSFRRESFLTYQFDIPDRIVFKPDWCEILYRKQKEDSEIKLPELLGGETVTVFLMLHECNSEPFKYLL